MPDAIRTHDLQSRSLTLYPAELRAHIRFDADSIPNPAREVKQNLAAEKIVKKVDKSRVIPYNGENDAREKEDAVMKKQHVSDAVIRRLPRYYRYLDELHSRGIVRISSSTLGKRMGVTASQIRQDLSCFGEFGQQGYGYNIVELRAEIGRILGVDEPRRLIVIGAGHLGHALLQNFDFAQGGFVLDTAFDVSPALIGTQVNGVAIRSMEELPAYCAANRPAVAVLTVPKSAAQETAERLVALGAEGLWNFTNVELSVDERVFVENVHFADSLLTLSYRISKESDTERDRP